MVFCAKTPDVMRWSTFKTGQTDAMWLAKCIEIKSAPGTGSETFSLSRFCEVWGRASMEIIHNQKEFVRTQV